MAEVSVPMLGESVLEATVGHWLKREGQAVTAGEVLVELETEKVNAEVAADRAGVLERIVHSEGETVHPGDVLAIIAEGAEATSTAPAAEDDRSASAAAPFSEQRAQPDGSSAAPGARAPADQAHEGAAPAARSTEGAIGPSPAARASESRVSPLAERIAAERKLDLSGVRGSGPGGRILKEDVDRLAEASQLETALPERAAVPAGAGTSAAQPPEPSPTQPPPGREARQAPPEARPELVPEPGGAATGMTMAGARLETRQRLSRRRLTIARRLVEAQRTAAMLTTFNEIDMSSVMGLRQRQRQSFRDRHGVDLGYMSFFTKASIAALKLFPEVNAELAGDELVLKHYYDIGVAIGDPEGLVVPVLRDAQAMTFADIERAIAELVLKSRERMLTLDDLRGGTFTITNGGVYGSLMSTPILNPPQVAILGLHKIESRPVAVDGQVTIRSMMYVALSYDHRVVDGREAVQFLGEIKRHMEQPELLLLEA